MISFHYLNQIKSDHLFISCNNLICIYKFIYTGNKNNMTGCIYKDIRSSLRSMQMRCTITKISSIVNVLKFGKRVAYQKCIDKQRRPRSACFWRSSLIRVFPVCYPDKHLVTSSSDNQHFISQKKMIWSFFSCKNNIGDTELGCSSMCYLYFLCDHIQAPDCCLLARPRSPNSLLCWHYFDSGYI